MEPPRNYQVMSEQWKRVKTMSVRVRLAKKIVKKVKMETKKLSMNR